MSFPKIELHVHLEGTVRPRTLLEIARRNDVALPADNVEGLRKLYRFRDFADFIEAWTLTTSALRTAEDFRQVVLDYAREAAGHGAVLVGRGTVLDVCPISNVRTGAIASLAGHPLSTLLAAGVACSISTDDPAMFDTDLTSEYATARGLGASPRSCYDAGLQGALCDEDTKTRLRQRAASFDWNAVRSLATAPAAR